MEVTAAHRPLAIPYHYHISAPSKILVPVHSFQGFKGASYLPKNQLSAPTNFSLLLPLPNFQFHPLSSSSLPPPSLFLGTRLSAILILILLTPNERETVRIPLSSLSPWQCYSNCNPACDWSPNPHRQPESTSTTNYLLVLLSPSLRSPMQRNATQRTSSSLTASTPRIILQRLTSI